MEVNIKYLLQITKYIPLEIQDLAQPKQFTHLTSLTYLPQVFKMIKLSIRVLR